MDESTLNKPVNLQNLSLALGKFTQYYDGQLQSLYQDIPTPAYIRIWDANQGGYYGECTISQITDMVSSGFLPILRYDSRVMFYLVFFDSGQSASFIGSSLNTGDYMSGLFKINENGITYTDISASDSSLAISGNTITLTNGSGTTSSITLPVYNGGVTT